MDNNTWIPPGVDKDIYLAHIKDLDNIVDQIGLGQPIKIITDDPLTEDDKFYICMQVYKRYNLDIKIS